MFGTPPTIRGGEPEPQPKIPMWIGTQKRVAYGGYMDQHGGEGKRAPASASNIVWWKGEEGMLPLVKCLAAC